MVHCSPWGNDDRSLKNSASHHYYSIATKAYQGQSRCHETELRKVERPRLSSQLENGTGERTNGREWPQCLESNYGKVIAPEQKTVSSFHLCIFKKPRARGITQQATPAEERRRGDRGACRRPSPSAALPSLLFV